MEPADLLAIAALRKASAELDIELFKEKESALRKPGDPPGKTYLLSLKTLDERLKGYKAQETVERKNFDLFKENGPKLHALAVQATRTKLDAVKAAYDEALHAALQPSKRSVSFTITMAWGVVAVVAAAAVGALVWLAPGKSERTAQAQLAFDQILAGRLLRSEQAAERLLLALLRLGASLGLEPALEDVRALDLDRLARAAKHIRPLHRPVVGVLGPLQQGVDQFGVLARVLARQELLRLLRRRGFEINPEEQVRVAQQGGHQKHFDVLAVQAALRGECQRANHGIRSGLMRCIVSAWLEG